MGFVRNWAFAAVMALLLFAPRGEAQQAAKVPRIGFLSPALNEGRAVPAFREALAKLGYVDGRDVVIEARFAAGQADRFPKIAAEVVALNVDVIVAIGATTARAAKKATTRIPIVFASAIDPVADGVVANFNGPAGG